MLGSSSPDELRSTCSCGTSGTTDDKMQPLGRDLDAIFHAFGARNGEIVTLATVVASVLRFDWVVRICLGLGFGLGLGVRAKLLRLASIRGR